MTRGLLCAALVASACAKEPPKPVPVIDRAKFEALYRAGKNIQGAMDVGLNRLKLTELLQVLATEVSIAKDKATAEKERALASKYEAALAAYQDGASLLEILDGSEKVVYGFAGQPETRMYPHMTPVVEKYSLKLTTEQVGGKGKPIVVEYFTNGDVRQIWAAAGKLLNEANKAYYAEEVAKR